MKLKAKRIFTKGSWRFVFQGIIVCMVIFVSSCARIPIESVSYPTRKSIIRPSAPVLRKNVLHTVAPGETVWRIAKMYDVGINDITRANNLNTSKKIKMGQRLNIPAAAGIKPVITLYTSQKWKYIIIHHSATDVGNALCFHGSHKRRGFDNGLGYHFVISNGTKGKQTGQIEVSPRWIKQQNGAHCKASDMNYKGIGICLVGNFNKNWVSQEQMNALIYLVNTLRKNYKIPLKNIMGHGQVPKARTDCPGKNFPWVKFKMGIGK